MFGLFFRMLRAMRGGCSFKISYVVSGENIAVQGFPQCICHLAVRAFTWRLPTESRDRVVYKCWIQGGGPVFV